MIGFLMGSALAVFAMSMYWAVQIEHKVSAEIQHAITVNSAAFGFFMFIIGMLMLAK